MRRASRVRWASHKPWNMSGRERVHGTSYYSADRTAAAVIYGHLPSLPQLYGGVVIHRLSKAEIRSVGGPDAGRGGSLSDLPSQQKHPSYEGNTASRDNNEYL